MGAAPVPETQTHTGMPLYRHEVCVVSHGLNSKRYHSPQTLQWKDVWATDDMETLKQN